jgi:hypothetical protein
MEILTPTTREARVVRTREGRVERHRIPGERKILCMPAGVKKTADLQSLRDQHFNGVKAMLAGWLASGASIPDWLREETQTLVVWRSPARLHRLLARWREERFPGDQEPFAALQAWAKQDHHLGHWQIGTLGAWARRRAAAYRAAAAEIARRSSAVVIEDLDLRDFAKSPHPEDTQGDEVQKHFLQRVAAPSLLRSAIVSACKARGVAVVEVPAKDTTRRHYRCGEVVEADYEHDLRIRCPRCGEEYDQSENACLRMLAAAAMGKSASDD